MAAYYYRFLEQFGITDTVSRIVVLVYAGAFLFAILLRIVACVGYQSQYAIFKLYGKEIKSKDDAYGYKNGAVGKSVADYVKASDKGSASVSASAIVNKNVTNLGFIFWKYESLSRFIKGFENSILLIGLILAVFMEQSNHKH